MIKHRRTIKPRLSKLAITVGEGFSPIASRFICAAATRLMVKRRKRELQDNIRNLHL
jgi:hypothetical protein